MSKSRQQYLRNRGFTLIELILGIGLASMLIIFLLSFLDITLKVNEKDFIKDELLLHGRYTTEYIKEEILKADKIVDSSLVNGLDQLSTRGIGFMILNITDNGKNSNNENVYELSFTTYYFSGDVLERLNLKKFLVSKESISKRGILSRLPNFKKGWDKNQSGYNKTAFNVSRESSISLNDDNIVNINLFFKDEKSELLNFETNVYLRCEVFR